MDLRHHHWVEYRDDGALAVHKAWPGREFCYVILASMYSLIIAVNLFVGPFIARFPMSGKQAALCWAAGLATLAIGHALAAWIWARAPRGAWVIDGQGIEFRPRQGPPCRLAWKEVRWVRWGRLHFVLLGDGRRIALESGFLKDQWRPVHERVESLLSGRFDLMVRRAPEQPFRLWRVLAVSTPLGLATGLLLVKLSSFSVKWTAIAVLAYLVLTVATMLFCMIGLYRERARLNPTWRAPKSQRDDWEDWP
jgi:hypothetical protein